MEPVAASDGSKLRNLITTLGQVLLGKETRLELVTTCLLASGHLLLEDLPGVGKTSLASALAKAVQGSFSRIQFTSDLLPSDILGTRIYRRSDEKFDFVRGPIFANMVLADELNRAPPKTQSALLQAMNEGCITIDWQTLPLPCPFLVIATQNPRGYHGTYPLPESQRDRFLMRLEIGYPDPETEIRILSAHREKAPIESVTPVMDLPTVQDLQRKARLVDVPEATRGYLARLAEKTRSHPDVTIPVSPRGSISLMRAGQALCFIRGKEWVDIDTVKELAPHVLSHRIGLKSFSHGSLAEGASNEWIVQEILQRTGVE